MTHCFCFQLLLSFVIKPFLCSSLNTGLSGRQQCSPLSHTVSISSLEERNKGTHSGQVYVYGQVTGTKSNSGAVVEHHRMSVSLKTTSNVKQYFKSGTAPLYCSLVTSPFMYSIYVKCSSSKITR